MIQKRREGGFPARKSIGRFFVLIFLISLFIVYFLPRDVSPLKTIPPRLLFVLGGIHLASLLLHSSAILLLLNRLRPRSSFAQVYLTLTASSAVGYFLPGKLGLPVRVYLYHNLFGLGPAQAFGLLGWEVAVTTAIPLVFCFPALWIFTIDLGLFLPAGVLLFSFLALALMPFLFSSKAAHPRWVLKTRSLFSLLSPFTDGLRQTIRSLSLGTVGFVSLLCILVLFCSVWFCRLVLMHFGSPIPFLPLLSIQSLGHLAGVVSLMPMGLGAKELTLAVLLGDVGVPASVAGYTIIVQRVITTGLSFLLGLVSLLILWRAGALRWWAGHPGAGSAKGKDEEPLPRDG